MYIDMYGLCIQHSFFPIWILFGRGRVFESRNQPLQNKLGIRLIWWQLWKIGDLHVAIRSLMIYVRGLSVYVSSAAFVVQLCVFLQLSLVGFEEQAIQQLMKLPDLLYLPVGPSFSIMVIFRQLSSLFVKRITQLVFPFLN